jgi:nucleoside phosphorylase
VAIDINVKSPLPWLLVAVPREHRDFRRRVRFEQTLRDRPTSIWRCRLGSSEFILGETGVGGLMVGQTLDWLAERELPRFVFLAGFAGALADDLSVGDGVQAVAVVDPSGVRWDATLPPNSSFRTGTLLTSDRLLTTPDEKFRHAQRHEAHTVDMETSYVAAWCARRNTPWGCVRVVSDDVRTPVSKDVFELLEDGRVSPWRLTKALLRRPMLTRELIHLGRATATAATTIARAFAEALR